MTQNKPSYDELLRLLWQARDIIIAQGESTDVAVQLNQHGWLNGSDNTGHGWVSIPLQENTLRTWTRKSVSQ